MLKCLQLEEIERHLMEVPHLADCYERRESDFVTRVITWLAQLENIFHNNRMAAAGIIASKRTLVLSAGQGVIPEGVVIQGRLTRRKLRNAAAIQALNSATSLTENLIQPDRDKQRQAQDMVRRIVALAKAKKLRGYGQGSNHSSDDERWASLNSDRDTKGGAIQLEGLVGHMDALILLNRGASGI